MPGELDLIIGPQLPIRDRGILSKLTSELETAETLVAAERTERAAAPLSISGIYDGSSRTDQSAEQAARTESAISGLIKKHLGRFSPAVIRTLRTHILERYDRAFIPGDDILFIESSMRKSVSESGPGIDPASFYDSLGIRRPKDLPATPGAVKELLRREMEARWVSALAVYSADRVLDETERILSALASTGIDLKIPLERTAGLRAERSRLLRFFRSAPEFVRLLRPESLYRGARFTSGEIGILKDFFITSRELTEADWKHLKGDEIARTLLEKCIPGLDVMETGPRLEFSKTLGIGWGEFLGDFERLIGVHRALCETSYSLPSYTEDPSETEDPLGADKLKKLISEGRSICDRVMVLLLRAKQGTTPAMRLSVLELLNNRIAGRLFLSDEKYLSLQPVFTAFLEQLYGEVDFTVREELGKAYNLGSMERIIIREPAVDIVGEEKILCRIVSVFIEGIDEFGFPYVKEIEISDAARIYSRVFWLLTQGSEADVSEDAVLDWAWSHGQIVISMRLSFNLRTGPETRAGHLGSYPELLARNFPDYHKAYIDLVRECAYPWFRRSFRMTFPVLIEEYKARGFEGLYLAQAVLRRISGAGGASFPAAESPPYTEGMRTAVILRDLRDLKISLEEAEKRLKSGENLFETVDRLTLLLGKEVEIRETELKRAGPYEEYKIRGKIAEIAPPRFAERGAEILRHLNDSLDRSVISGASYLTLRELVGLKIGELFSVSSMGDGFEKWRSELFTSGTINARERSEWSRP